MGTVHTSYWDAVGNPVLVVPMGFTEGGLPLSLQLAGRPFEEALLVQAGDAFQQATDWHLRVPPLVTPDLARSA
jgi:aspartyl-tRNA(Asn)/glutamyl-tRNA(Gln) amidotransferase subunit A